MEGESILVSEDKYYILRFNTHLEIDRSIIYQMSAGVASGLLVGYAIKKILKILMIILGFSFIAVFYLGLSGIINIDYEKLTSATSGLVTQASEFLSTAVGGFPFASTFLAGLGIGIMKG